MKFLIVIAVIAGVLWLMRSLRKPHLPPTPAQPSSPKNEEMVACAQCGVHLPRSEALPGRGGVFCGEAHRAAYESRRGS
ncbi:MAG TPA: PP0621 family protein [Rhizobacter sp.]|nr:PP0621 family protein [Rhizobacter sp.]